MKAADAAEITQLAITHGPRNPKPRSERESLTECTAKSILCELLRIVRDNAWQGKSIAVLSIDHGEGAPLYLVEAAFGDAITEMQSLGYRVEWTFMTTHSTITINWMVLS